MLSAFNLSSTQKHRTDESSSTHRQAGKKARKIDINYDGLLLHEKVTLAATKGDVKTLKEIFEPFPGSINMECPDYPALYHAAIANQFDAVDYLLDKGAEIGLLGKSTNIIDAIKVHNAGKHTAISKFIKACRGFDKERLAFFSQHFKVILEKELNEAKMRNKNLLVLLGEHHGNYKIQQLEKQIVKIMKQLGVNVLYKELPVGAQFHLPVFSFAEKELNMTTFCIDNHPQRRTSATVEERNQVMAFEMLRHNQHGVLITGALHLEGLLQNDLSRYYFHMVPFNLTFADITSSHQDNFLVNCQNVINVFEDRITLSDPVVARWNSDNSVSNIARSLLNATSTVGSLTQNSFISPLVSPYVSTFLSFLDRGTHLLTEELAPAAASERSERGLTPFTS